MVSFLDLKNPNFIGRHNTSQPRFIQLIILFVSCFYKNVHFSSHENKTLVNASSVDRPLWGLGNEQGGGVKNVQKRQLLSCLVLPSKCTKIKFMLFDDVLVHLLHSIGNTKQLKILMKICILLNFRRHDGNERRQSKYFVVHFLIGL